MNRSEPKPPRAKRIRRNTLRVIGNDSERSKLVTQTALRPSVQAGVTLQSWAGISRNLDLTELVSELSAQAQAASTGSLERLEEMLMTQAHTLDAIFNELARRAALNMGQYLRAAETLMRLALKAQSQCRATLETLAEIKNPSAVAFVRQANIAHGPQQVNNGMLPADASRAETRNCANQTIGVPA